MVERADMNRDRRYLHGEQTVADFEAELIAPEEVYQEVLRVSESRQGVLEYKEVFDRLGISMKDKEGRFKGLEDLPGDVSDAFAGMTDDLEITAAALDLFGQRGAAMVNLLRNGSASINRFREDVRIISWERKVPPQGIRDRR